jgi:CheY-like chemotaxis protein
MSATDHVPPPPKAARGNVLIVDDVLLVRMWIAEFLRGRGFDVIEAASGEEAIGTLEAGRPVDLVLTDLYMPGAAVDGLSLARWIHERRPDLKIVLASGVTHSLEPSDEAICACPLVPKPYDHKELERRLAAVLEPARPD